MRKLVLYDDKHDILFIHQGFARDEKFNGNIDIGDIVLDVSTRKRIRGIEIFNATQFLKDFDISKSVLKNIINADFKATIKPNRIILGIFLKAKKIKHDLVAKVAVPLAVPTRSM